MLNACRRKRPHVLRSHGRRLSITGTRPEEMDSEKLREVLEKALPHLVGQPLRVLIYEYWMFGEHFENLKIKFTYYP